MTYEEIKALQELPLDVKIKESQKLIKEWVEHWDGKAYISFSGGKDSTVLLDIVRDIYPDLPGVFCDTGLEYPEIRRFVGTIDNVCTLRPEKAFHEIIETYGYPVISKEQAQYIHEARTTRSEKLKKIRLEGQSYEGDRRKWGNIAQKWLYLLEAPFKISDRCCKFMKKKPFRKYEQGTASHPITGMMCEESLQRRSRAITYGFNAYNATNPSSMSLGFWTEQDILRYITEKALPYCEVYGDIVEDEKGTLATTGCTRTGCMFCMFGVHLEDYPNRFQRMQKTHPALWDYCIRESGLGVGKVLDYIGVPYRLEQEE